MFINTLGERSNEAKEISLSLSRIEKLARLSRLRGQELSTAGIIIGEGYK